MSLSVAQKKLIEQIRDGGELYVSTVERMFTTGSGWNIRLNGGFVRKVDHRTADKLLSLGVIEMARQRDNKEIYRLTKGCNWIY